MVGVEYHDNAKRVTIEQKEQRLLALLSPFSLHEGEDRPIEDVNAGEILKQLGFSKPSMSKWLNASKRNGSSIDDEILMETHIDEEAYYGTIARHLRLPYHGSIDERYVHYHAIMDKQLIAPRVLRIHPMTTCPKLLIVPELSRLKAIASILSANPQLRDNLVVTNRSAMRTAIWRSGANERNHRAITELSEKLSDYSAKTVVNGKQGFTLGICFSACLLAIVDPSSRFLLAAHALCSTLYFLSNIIRLLALFPRFRLPFRRDHPLPRNAILPVYSILVPLHREKDVVPQLIKALEALNWPRSRLDIKLICEADDQETLEALQSVQLGREYEIIRVPPSQPRTKPKALQYALPAVRGQFLTIYDAEDRPHPEQLQEAYRKFFHGEEALGCLQAPLVITNIRQSWISALFAVEYSALFRRFLPMLAANRLPLPLGGTSNHFKTSILRQVGGWDPFNVTEDADLGIRLSRAGFQIDVLTLPTFEDAPTESGVWMKQRIRLYKGWTISWLVMLRSPVTTIQQLGVYRFVIAQLIIGNMVLSSLFHPFMLSFIITTAGAFLLPSAGAISSAKLSLLGLDLVNIVSSYVLFLLAAHMAMHPLERIRLGPRWMFTPLYWLMLSLAAWRSLYELKKRPFHWNKTPHKPST